MDEMMKRWLAVQKAESKLSDAERGGSALFIGIAREQLKVVIAAYRAALNNTLDGK